MIEIGVKEFRPDSLVSRRGLLRVSMLTGTGEFVSQLLHSAADAKLLEQQKSNTALIQIWLGGGPSQYETYDMKPDAPGEIRGAFQPIATNVSGIQICELLPLQAKLMDRLSVIRSLSHDSNIHHAAVHWMQTAHFGPPNKQLPEKNSRPAAGSVVSALRGANRKGMVPYVHIASDALSEPTLLLPFGPAYLGAKYAPMRIKPARVGKYQSGEGYYADLIGKPKFELPEITLLDGMTVDRLQSRGNLLNQLDRFARRGEQQFVAHDVYRRQAIELITIPAAREAFDLTRESARTRERYGNNMWGQAALMARRLVEAGVTFVTVNTDAYSLAWDSHSNLEREFRKMMPIYDRMLSALIDDLVDRGLYDRVILLVVGEFGRTQKINSKAGRDHWGKSGVALLGGGRIPGGHLIGSTNARGSAPASRPISPGDLWATVYRALGIDANKYHFEDQFNRPFPVLSHGKPIPELA